MVSSRVIRAADCQVMPWKNGLGSTTEIAVEPPGASLDGFDWRVSIAELRGSGPFSRFPGYERVILQLDGPPMSLAHGGAAVLPLRPLVPHAFSGDDETDCTVEGIAHDFNLMVRRGHARPAVDVVTLGAGDEIEAWIGATRIVHLREGELATSAGETLAAGDTCVEGAGERRACHAIGDALVLVASLAPAQG